MFEEKTAVLIKALTYEPYTPDMRKRVLRARIKQVWDHGLYRGGMERLWESGEGSW